MNILGKKKNHKKEPHPSPLTPPSMESDDLDPSTIIFHQPLPIAARRSDHVWEAVPSPVRLAVDWLNKKGLNEEGLYRVPGKATTFATYKALFDRGVEFDFFELHEMAPENVAMVLIKYLQSLPDPIYSAKFEAHFKLALAIQNEQERATVMRGIMYMIPLAYRETCRVLVDHLKLVAANSEVNKMTIRNVELTWSLSVGQMTGAVVRVLSESPFPVPSTLQFHVPLSVAIENTPREMTVEKYSVPYAVSRLVAYLKENDAFTTPLLFSTEPKSAETLDDVIYVLNGGSLGVDGAFPADMSVIYAAAALKQWIADVPGETGLFPDAMCPDFVHVIPPSSPDSKPINYSQMPEKLEHLLWKLPDIHLETIKALLDVLLTWTSFAPEDMTCLQAVELLFVGYPVPLQHVLAFLLHNFSALFGTGDSALTAHLQSLVGFGGPGAVAAPGGFASPLSPRHVALNTKASPLSPHQPTTTSLSAATSGSNGHFDSGSVSPRAGISPTYSSITSPTSPTAATVALVTATAAAPAVNSVGGEHSADSGSGSAGSGANASPSDAIDHAASSSTSKRDAKAAQEAAETGQEKPTSTTPSKAYKKSKTLKAGTSPLTPGKLKKHKEAEDGTPTKKTKTPKSAKGTPKMEKALDSPVTSTKGSSIDSDEVPRSRHMKSTSADVDSPVSERRRTPKRRDISDPTSPSSAALSRSASSDKASSSNQESAEKPEKTEKTESTDTPSTSSSTRAAKRLKDSPSTPSTPDADKGSAESRNGKESKTKGTAPSASPAPSHTSHTTDDTETPTKTKTQEDITTKEDKPTKRAKAVSSPAAAQTVSSPSTETTKKPKADKSERDESKPKSSKTPTSVSTMTGSEDTDPPQNAGQTTTEDVTDGSTKLEANGKKKERRKSKLEEIADSPAGSDENDGSADNSTPTKAKKRKSLGGATNGTEEKKSERRKSKPQSIDTLTSQEEEPSSEDAQSPAVDGNAKKTRKTAIAAEEGARDVASPKKARIKVTTPAEPTQAE